VTFQKLKRTCRTVEQIEWSYGELTSISLGTAPANNK
jgi:hypothetical protein